MHKIMGNKINNQNIFSLLARSIRIALAVASTAAGAAANRFNTVVYLQINRRRIFLLWLD